MECTHDQKRNATRITVMHAVDPHLPIDWRGGFTLLRRPKLESNKSRATAIDYDCEIVPSPYALSVPVAGSAKRRATVAGVAE